MPRGKELVKNSFILVISKMLINVISFCLMPIYTSVLSQADYGEADFISSLSMIILPFLTLQTEMGMFRYFIAEKGENEKKQVFSTSLMIIIICLSLATIFFFPLSLLFKLKNFILIYLFYFTLCVYTFLLQTARSKSDNVCYGFSSFGNAALAMILNIIFVAWLKIGLIGILLAQIISNIALSIFIIYKTKILYYWNLSAVSMTKCNILLNYSIPLIFNQISSWIINFSDRVLIICILGMDYNGIYAIANKFSNILIALFNMYVVAWTENIIKSMNDEDHLDYLSRIIELTYNLYIILITGILNILPFIFHIMINGNFDNSYYHIPILLMGAFFSGMAAMIGSIFNAYAKTKNVSFTTIFAAAVNIICHFVLIYQIELYAASISTLISFFILFIYRLFTVKDFCKIKIRINQISLSTIILIISCISYEIKNTCLIITCLLLNIINILLLINKYKDWIRSNLKIKHFFRKTGL